MMRRSLWLAVAAGTLWTGQAAAVNTEGYDIPYAGFSYAREFSDSTRDSDDGNGFQFSFGMPLDWYENNAVEVWLHNTSRERRIDGNKDYQMGLMVDLVHDFGLFGWGEDAGAAWLPKFTPFVLGGLGVVQDDVRGDKNTSVGVNLGTGLLFPLPWNGMAARVEWRMQTANNDQSVPGEDLLIDYRVNVGVQVPLTPFFARSDVTPEPPKECDLAVVNPDTGRSDCGDDTDRDGVLDSADQCPGTPDGTPVDAKGCPITGGDAVPLMDDSSGGSSGRGLTMRNVYFTKDTAEFTAESRKVLDEVVEALKAQDNVQVEIGGHADSQGSQAYNLMLSQVRAEAVRQYLIARGISPTRLVSQGYGEFRPAAQNETPDARADNRRVEFKLIVQ